MCLSKQHKQSNDNEKFWSTDILSNSDQNLTRQQYLFL
jgi:hypothetical protein